MDRLSRGVLENHKTIECLQRQTGTELDSRSPFFVSLKEASVPGRQDCSHEVHVMYV